MKFEIIGLIPWLISLIIIIKRDYGWPSERIVTTEMILFRTIYLKWENETKFWD
jgi:hypothetical protein